MPSTATSTPEPTSTPVPSVTLRRGVNPVNKLEAPNDKHLIVTFHYYLPFQFTHQGAE